MEQKPDKALVVSSIRGMAKKGQMVKVLNFIPLLHI